MLGVVEVVDFIALPYPAHQEQELPGVAVVEVVDHTTAVQVRLGRATLAVEVAVQERGAEREGVVLALAVQVH